MDLEKNIEKKAGPCFGCMHYNGEEDNECDQNYKIKDMQKKKFSCYEEYAGVLNSYSFKDEFDNVCED
jgi:hypothetical protein